MRTGGRAVGHPVDVATGAVYFTTRDIEIPGRRALVWSRHYSTDLLAEPSGMLGPGWAVPYETSLRLTADGVELTGPEGDRERFEDPDDLLSQGQGIVHFGTFRELERSGSEYHVTHWNVDTDRVQRFCYGPVPGVESTYRLIRIEDVTAEPLLVEWDGAGRLARVRQALEGRALTFSYLRGGLLGAVTAHGTNGEVREVARYSYDGSGRLVEVTDAIGRTQAYAYDGDSRITREVVKDGSAFAFEYDREGRCVHTSGDNGYDAKDLRYFDQANFTQVADSRGNITTYQWLPTGQVVTEIDAVGARRETEYDEHGRIAAITDRNGSVTAYGYDEFGNRDRVVDPTGAVTLNHYNERHQVVEIIDAHGTVWTRAYDERGNWIVASDPEGIEWRFDRNARGQLTAITNPKGDQRRLFYDERGVPTGHTDWMGRRTELEYDGFGHLLSQVDPSGRRTTLARDRCDRIVSIQTAGSGPLRYEYDDGDNLARITDSTGRTRQFSYGTCGRMLEETDTLGQTVRYTWGTEPGQLEQIINEKGETYSFEYDLAGRVIQRVPFDGRMIRYEYDAGGNRTAEYRGDRLTVRSEYGEGGLLLSRETDDGRVEFQYDLMNRITSAVNVTCSIEIERDYRGRVVRERQGDQVLEYEYDPLDQVLSIESSLGHRVEYTYDPNGNLRSVRTADGDEVRLQVDEVGRETRRELPGGLELWQEYNEHGQLSTQVLGSRFGEQDRRGRARPESPVVTREYEYGPTGTLTHLTDGHWGTRRYEYDLLDRLTRVSGRGGDESFTYDPAGNLLSARLPGEPEEEFRYDPGSRLESAGEFSFEYDESGRRIAKRRMAEEGEPLREWVYEWNDFDRLTAVVTPEGERWEYAYDAFGRRVRKTGPGGTTDFVWDGCDLVHEKQGDELRTWIHDPYAFKLLGQIEDGRFFSVVTDHLGTPRELIDGSGDIAWRSQHRAWGERVTGEGRWSVDCPWVFPGQYADRESGLYYNFYRYYDPARARYLSPDPFELLGGLNEFAYCRNPVNWIDPLGLGDCSDDDDGEYVYQLVKDGEVVYYGITNDPKRRVREHSETKDFDRMEVLTDRLSHNDARNLEARLIRDRIDGTPDIDTSKSVRDQLDDAGLLNRNRGRADDADRERGRDFADTSHIIDDPAERTTHENPSKPDT